MLVCKTSDNKHWGWKSKGSNPLLTTYAKSAIVISMGNLLAIAVISHCVNYFPPIVYKYVEVITVGGLVLTVLLLASVLIKVVPMPIELNDWGMAVWRHKENKNLFVERPYRWCDRIILLDETNSRSIVDSTEFSTFDFTDWIPVTVEEFQVVKSNFKEIYGLPHLSNL